MQENQIVVFIYCMETLTVHPKNKKQLATVEAVLKALGVVFKKENEAELTEREKTINLYGKEFVEKIERADADIKAGRVTHVKPEDLQSFLGLK